MLLKGLFLLGITKNYPAHLPNHIESKIVLWKALINKGQQEKLDSLFTEGEDLRILIMNVEALSTTKGTAFAYKFISAYNTLMAIDESTTIKNPKAKRTKNILKLAQHSKYRRILNWFSSY